MAKAPLEVVVRHIRKIVDVQTLEEATDGQLVERFARGHEEQAFATLLRRHGPMVLGVSQGILRQLEDAEDVFQATFLLLARKAGSIRKRESVASWLHGVAHRLAVRAKAQRALRRAREMKASTMRRSVPSVEEAWRELRPVLHEEMEKLPEKYRTALVLYYLERKTQEEAARALDCPVRTVQSRLGRGRKLLQERLTRRGLTLSAGSFTAFLVAGTPSATLQAQLLDSTLKASLQFATARSAAALVSAPVAALVEGGLKAMLWTKLKIATALLLAFSFVAGAGALAHQVLEAKPLEIKQDTEVQPAAKRRDSGVQEQARTDRSGDPLPVGAIARLGTVPFRHVAVGKVIFSPDGKTLTSGGGDMVLRFWDVATGKQRRMFVAYPLGAGNFAFSPDGKLLATANRFDADLIQLWEAATGRKIRESRPTNAAPSPFATAPSLLVFSPDGSTLASSRADARIVLWDVATGQELFNLVGHQTSKFDWQNAVRALAFSPDGQWLLSSGKDGIGNGGRIRVSERATGKQAFVLRCSDEPVAALAFAPNGAPDGNIFVSGGYLPNSFPYVGTLRLWDLNQGKQLREFKRDGQGAVVAVAISPDGSTLASGCMDKSVQLWDLASGKLVRDLQGHRDNFAGLYSLAFSPDGKTLAAGGNDHVIHLWEVATGRRLFHDLDAQEGTIRSVALSADGQVLATGSYDGTISLWDLVTGKRLRTIRGHKSVVYTMVFSPDSKLLASGGSDCTIRLWETATGEEQRKLQVGKFPVGQVVCLALSTDGKLLASGHTGSEKGEGYSCRIWEVATSKELQQIKNSYGAVVALAFSSDAKRLTTACRDGTIRQWQVTTGEELSQFLTGEGAFREPVAFSVDGKMAATQSREGSTVLQDLSSGKQLAVLMVPNSESRVLAISPDDRFLVSCYGGVQPTINKYDKTIRVWEISSGKEVIRFDVPFPSFVASATFSADARTLITGMNDATVLIWNLVPLPAQGEPRQPGPKSRSLEKLWADLASEDASKAYAALWTLAADAERAVSFLQARLRPVAPVEPQRLDQLIADLESDQFQARQNATEALDQLRELAEPALRQKLRGQPGLETRQRLEQLLKRFEGPITSSTKLQTLRAIQILERIGSQEAQNLLKHLAAGTPVARETQEAKAALERLAKRPTATP